MSAASETRRRDVAVGQLHEDHVVAAAIVEIRRRSISGPDRVAIYQAVETARAAGHTGTGPAVARQLLKIAEDPATSPIVSDALTRIAPEAMRGGLLL